MYYAATILESSEARKKLKTQAGQLHRYCNGQSLRSAIGRWIGQRQMRFSARLRGIGEIGSIAYWRSTSTLDSTAEPSIYRRRIRNESAVRECSSGYSSYLLSRRLMRHRPASLVIYGRLPIARQTYFSWIAARYPRTSSIPADTPMRVFTAGYETPRNSTPDSVT